MVRFKPSLAMSQQLVITAIVCLLAGFLRVSLATSAGDVVSQGNLRSNYSPTDGKIKLPSIYGSHQVFKHSSTQIIWGIAGADDNISIHLSDNTFHDTVKSDAKSGRSEFVLPPHAPVPSSSSIDIVITSSKDSITLTDITFGEVLLCGGQSNMAITVRMAMNASYEISRSDIPELRLLQVANLDSFGTQSTPLINTTMSMQWSRSSPSVTPLFSAVCYFTGKKSFARLTGRHDVGID